MPIPEEIADQIRYDLAQGDPVDKIAIRYGYSEEEVQALAPRRRLNPHKLLTSDLDRVGDAIEIATTEYQTHRGNHQAFALTELLRERRSIMTAIDEAEDPVALFDEIRQNVIHPLIKKMVQGLSEPISDFRKQVEQLIPPERRRHLSDYMKTLLRSQGENLEAAYSESRKALATTLDIDLADLKRDKGDEPVDP